jgi:hypothetical protein
MKKYMSHFPCVSITMFLLGEKNIISNRFKRYHSRNIRKLKDARVTNKRLDA